LPTETDAIERSSELHCVADTEPADVERGTLKEDSLTRLADVEASGVDHVALAVDDSETQTAIEPTAGVLIAAASDSTPTEFEKPPGLPEPHQRNKQPRDPAQSADETPLHMPLQYTERSTTPPEPEVSASSEQVYVPASNMANSTRSLVEESGETAKGMSKSNTDTVTPEMLQQLSDFMNKRAKMASDSVFETFKERLPHIIDANGGTFRSKTDGRDREVGVHATLKGVIKDTNCIIEQMAKGEKAASATLKQMSDPELMKQSKPLKSSVEKVVSQWRDSVLNKTVLMAGSGKQAVLRRFRRGITGCQFF